MILLGFAIAVILTKDVFYGILHIVKTDKGEYRAMKQFNSAKDALEYAGSLNKNESEIAIVEGKKTLLSATSLPIEARFRLPLETILRETIKEFGDDASDEELDDAVCDIGAELSNTLIDMIEKRLGYQILSPYQNY